MFDIWFMNSFQFVTVLSKSFATFLTACIFGLKTPVRLNMYSSRYSSIKMFDSRYSLDYFTGRPLNYLYLYLKIDTYFCASKQNTVIHCRHTVNELWNLCTLVLPCIFNWFRYYKINKKNWIYLIFKCF